MPLHLTSNEITFLVVSFLLLFITSSYLLLLVAVALLAFFLSKRKEVYFIWSIIAPRITGGAPILEFMLALAREEGPGNKELGDVMRLDIPFLKPLFFVFKPSYLKKILALEADNFSSKGSEGVMVKIAMGGNNILLNEGPPNPHWVKFRELTSEINKDRFGENSLIAKLFEVTWKTTQELAHRFDSMRGKNLNLFYELYHVMIPAHNRALFGEEFARKYSYNELSHEVHEVITETGKQLKFAFSPPSNEAILLGQTKRVANAIHNMAKESNSPFMKQWLEALRSGQLTEEEFLSNLLIFEYAQAPLHVVFWLLYLLALHPEEEKKVMLEIAQVLSKGPITHSRIPEFKYLSRVLTETMRLYPGVGLMQVRFPKTNSMLGGHFVPAGSTILLCNYIIHRNATHWPNPDDFDPTREGLDTTHSGETLMHIPFGYGPRQCQGQYFAQDFMKATVINILLQHKLVLAPGQNAAYPTEIGFLRPAFPVYFQFQERVMPKLAESPLAVPVLPLQQAGAYSASSSPQLQLQHTQLLRVQQSEQPSQQQQLLSTSQAKMVSPRKKGPPPMLSRASRIGTLAAQSQIFKDSFISLGKVNRSSKDLLVLYGSQSGHAREFAMRLVHMAGLCKISATPLSMADLDVSTISQYKTVVISTSTYGDGGPPESGELFASWLGKEHPATLWRGLSYAVLSLGSSMYNHPFRFGSFVSRRFGQLGAKQLVPDGRLDEIKYNQQEEFTTWSVTVFESLTQAAAMHESRTLVARNKVLGFQNFDFNLLNAPFSLKFGDKRVKKESRVNYPANAVVATVVSNVPACNQIYSIELAYKSGALSFLPGDTLSVIPANNADLVEKLIARLGFEKDLVFSVEDKEISGIVDLACSSGKNKCTLEIALTYYYDITKCPSATLLQFFGMNSVDAEDQKILASYSTNILSFLRLEYSIFDVLEMFPSIQLFNPKDTRKSEETLAIFLGLLGPIIPRHYSVANSPDVLTHSVRVVYKVIEYQSKSRQQRLGLCSNYLKSKTKGDEVVVFVSKTKFRLPENTETPIIMVGAGSGISPYFGFLEHRHFALNKNVHEKLGQAVLIHGCRSESDFALKPKVDQALTDGILTKLWPAYSKPEGGGQHEHIQDVIKREGAELWNLLSTEETTLFICGDIKIGLSVKEAFINIAKTHGKLGAFKANRWYEGLEQAGRIRHDEWGVSTQSGASVIRAARLRLWRKSIHTILAFATINLRQSQLRESLRASPLSDSQLSESSSS